MLLSVCSCSRTTHPLPFPFHTKAVVPVLPRLLCDDYFHADSLPCIPITLLKRMFDRRLRGNLVALCRGYAVRCYARARRVLSNTTSIECHCRNPTPETSVQSPRNSD